MTAPPITDRPDLIALRAEVAVYDERMEVERIARTTSIKGRLAAASRNPWYVHSADGVIRVLCRTSTSTYNKIASVLKSNRNQRADADLIAHAPTDLTWMLAETDRLRAERDLLLEHAGPDTQLAYWKLRADARQEELEASR
jgi:hypothetical protein